MQKWCKMEVEWCNPWCMEVKFNSVRPFDQFERGRLTPAVTFQGGLVKMRFKDFYFAFMKSKKKVIKNVVKMT